MRWRRTSEPGVVVEALAGAASGLAASWLMEWAQKPIMRAGGPATQEREKAAQGDLEPATARAARRAAGIVRRSIPDQQIGPASEAVHYAVGGAFGALFAVLARRSRASLLLAGALFGAAVWLVNDETLVPALGFSRAPWAYPASTHAKALAAHLVYGTATGAGLGLVRAAGAAMR